MVTSPSSPPGAQREHLNLNAAVADFGGHVCILQSIWIVSPLLRQIQRAIINGSWPCREGSRLSTKGWPAGAGAGGGDRGGGGTSEKRRTFPQQAGRSST